MSPRKRRAVLTMVRNEAVFLPVWLRYYSRFFAPEDIYVLDHESSDGSTDGGGFVRIPVAHDRIDHLWMVSTIAAQQHELLERYDVVLATDVDEIVAPNPESSTLGEYIDGFEAEFVNCLGYEILHLKDTEGPLQLDRPLLEQRSCWYPNAGYDKPLLASVPMAWGAGFHRRADGHVNLDPTLRLIHLHRMDYDICRSRHRPWQEGAWNERDVAEGWAYHNRITDPVAFERWFYEDSCFEGIGVRIAPEPIPPVWKSLI